MQFLYPNFLWALFALSIPIIIHLFNFRKYKKVYFSNVAFLQNIRKETQSKSTLKNLILLLIRLLVIAFLVLVFARPYIPVNNDVKNSGTPMVAIYIDNSFSMEAEGKNGLLLEAAKMKAHQLTEAFPYSTQYLLVTNNFEWMHQQWVAKEQFIDWVSQVQATHIFRSVNQVSDRIHSLLPSKDSTLKLNTFLLSDFQKNTIEQNVPLSLTNSMVYLVVFPNRNSANVLIDSIWFETPGHYIGKQEVLNVLVKNFSGEKYTDIPMQLYINDTLKASVVYSVEENDHQIVTIPFANWRAGVTQLKLEINDYPITFDNSFYANFTVEPACNVLIISDRKAIDYFATLFNDDENFITTSVDLRNIPYNNFFEYPLIILNELPEMNSGLISGLIAYIKQGGQVVFIPKIDGNVNDYNLFLSQVIGVRFESWQKQLGKITEPDESNELFEAAFKKSIKESRFPEYQGYFPITYSSKTGFSVLYKAESGSNLFIYNRFGEGKIYISALPFNKQVTDLATHPIFVPLFYNIGLQSTGQNISYYGLKPNTVAQLMLKSYTGENVQLLSETENLDFMPKSNYQNGTLLIFPQTDKMKAGTYNVKLDGNVEGKISFNYDRKESDVKCFSENELEDIFKKMGVNKLTLINPTASEFASEIKKMSEGNDLTQLFLWFVLVLFLIEILVIKLIK
jgi:hypothetical protein